jgi:hypothetical protein
LIKLSPSSSQAGFIDLQCPHHGARNLMNAPFPAISASKFAAVSGTAPTPARPAAFFASNFAAAPDSNFATASTATTCVRANIVPASARCRGTVSQRRVAWAHRDGVDVGTYVIIATEQPEPEGRQHEADDNADLAVVDAPLLYAHGTEAVRPVRESFGAAAAVRVLRGNGLGDILGLLSCRAPLGGAHHRPSPWRLRPSSYPPSSPSSRSHSQAASPRPSGPWPWPSQRLAPSPPSASATGRGLSRPREPPQWAAPPFPPDTGTAYAYLATRRSADVFRVGESRQTLRLISTNCPFRFTWALRRASGLSVGPRAALAARD